MFKNVYLSILAGTILSMSVSAYAVDLVVQDIENLEAMGSSVLETVGSTVTGSASSVTSWVSDKVMPVWNNLTTMVREHSYISAAVVAGVAVAVVACVYRENINKSVRKLLCLDDCKQVVKKRSPAKFAQLAEAGE